MSRAVTPPPAKKPPTAWIIGGVVALIVLVAAVVAITSSGDDDESAPAAAAPAGAAESTTAGADDETEVSLDGGDTPGTGATPDGDTPETSIGVTPGTVVDERGDVLATGIALPAFEGGPVDPALGLVAPTLQGLGFDGSPRTIRPGRATFVVFLAHWCPHCRREVPRLVEWSESGDLPAGVDVVAVATATTPERDNFPPSAWLTEERWPFDVLLDDARSTAAFAYGLSAYPFFTLLDEQGRVLLRGSGDVDADSLTERIEAALAAEAPVATT